MKTQKNYTINTKLNGSFITRYVNFDNGTFAKVVIKEGRSLKCKQYNLISIDGDFDKTKISISINNLGGVEVFPISAEKAEVSNILKHKVFGKVEILTSNNGMLTIKLADNTKKTVMEKFFMNGVK